METTYSPLPVVTPGETKTFCCICEASCGLVASVATDGELTLRPDPEHPNSRGFACAKGISFPAVRTDPDRLLHPMKRQPDGTFAAVTWDEALDDIGRRLKAVISEHGAEEVGIHNGNPLAWNYAAFFTVFGMASALGTKHFYTSASTDINNYWVVGELLYGNNLSNTVPDLARTEFLLCLGANPVVSKGSMMNVGKVREAMLDISDRGGRVVVVDPRRTETAELFEHLPIRPDGDAWLLAAMLRVIFERGLQDDDFLLSATSGPEFVRDLVSGVDLERAARESGVPAGAITQLAVDFATASSAVAYGRCGTSLGRFSTLTKYLTDALNLVTGNVDRPGGACFGNPMIDSEKLLGALKTNGYDRWRTRVDGIPEVLGTSPVVSMPREITTPGPGQLRALIMVSCNLVTSGPATEEIRSALQQLELLVCLDPYLTETSSLADYVLPPALWPEREGVPIFTQTHAAVPYAQWSPALVDAPPDVREDWWILDQICRRIGLVPSGAPGAQLMGKLGIRPTPAATLDLVLRLSPVGDLFGLRRRGWNRKKLLAHGGGVQFASGLPTGVLRKRLHTKDKRVHLEHELFRDEVDRLVSHDSEDPEYPLRLFSVRELRSQNTWLQNVPKLMSGDRVQRLQVHPVDAAAHGIENGDVVRVESRHGAVAIAVHVTDQVMPGSMGMPHGWGHRGGWRLAVSSGGVNYNQLTANEAGSWDVPSGQAVLNGVPVRLVRADDLERA